MRIAVVARCDYSLLSESIMSAFSRLGHDVALFDLKKYRLFDKYVGRSFSSSRLAAFLRSHHPEMVFVVAPMFISLETLEVLAAYRRQQGGLLLGWIGDVFAATAENEQRLQLFDRIFVTDTHLQQNMNLDADAYLPLAADPLMVVSGARARDLDCSFVASRTENRGQFIAATQKPVAVYGPGWEEQARHPSKHRFKTGGLPLSAVFDIYARSKMTLNLKNAQNVVNGLNQRSFDPFLAGSVLIHDYINDLELNFDLGKEILVFHNVGEFEEVYDKVLNDPSFAQGILVAGRRRVLDCHTFEHRAKHILSVLNISLI